jgi:hypothetical protein
MGAKYQADTTLLFIGTGDYSFFTGNSYDSISLTKEENTSFNLTGAWFGQTSETSDSYF